MKTEIFSRFISLLEESPIRYALLGNTDAYPETIGSDVDVMIHPEDISQFHQLIWEIEDAHTRVVQMLQHETVAFYYVVAQIEEEGVSMLQPDVCTDYFRNGFKLLSAEELLQDTVYATDRAGRSKGFRILAPEKAFIYYLLKKIDKGSISEIQFAHLRTQFMKNLGGALAQVHRFWPNESLQAIQRAVEFNDLSLLQRQIPLLRQELHRSLAFSPKDWLLRMRLRFRRCLHPTGYVVQIEPGGEPADALGKALVDLLGGAFRRQWIIDLSKSGRVVLLALPAKILKAKIFSTLVILPCRRKPWQAPVDARIATGEKGMQIFFSGRRRNGMEASGPLPTPLALARVLLNSLSQRTRVRSPRF